MYTINELAKLAHISSRTLRYYDQIGLLKAQRKPDSDYRFYDDDAVNALQQILFFKSFGFSLAKIKEAMNLSQQKRLALLEEQYQLLLEQQAQLNKMIHTLSQTLVYYKGGNPMENREKFSAFKTEKELIWQVKLRKKFFVRIKRGYKLQHRFTMQNIIGI